MIVPQQLQSSSCPRTRLELLYAKQRSGKGYTADTADRKTHTLWHARCHVEKALSHLLVIKQSRKPNAVPHTLPHQCCSASI